MTLIMPTSQDDTARSAASLEDLERVAAALAARGFEAVVVPDGASARTRVRELIPDGAEVHSGSSVTLGSTGIMDDLESSGRYRPVRPMVRALDRETQAAEIRRLRSAPEIFVNSANAVTADGRLVWASRTGTQLGPIAAGAGRVILVIGAQKVVPDLDAAFDRIERTVLPLENERSRQAYGRGSAIHKWLVLDADAPGRTTVILVGEPLGF